MTPIAKLQHLIRKQENIDPEILVLINEVERELESPQLKLIECDPFHVMLENKNGDTFSYNPTSSFGEELDSFLYGTGVFNQQTPGGKHSKTEPRFKQKQEG